MMDRRTTIGLYFTAAAVAVVLGSGWGHSAMAQAVASRPDGAIACDSFQRTGYGTWTVLRPTTIHPQGVALSLAPGQSFAPSQTMDGIEVSAVLDRNCGNK